jgi:hypothetical protein
MDWSVYVEAAGPADAPPLVEKALELFAEHLSVYSPAVSGAVAPEQERIWSAQLAVSDDHGDPAAAAQHAVNLVISAARTAGLPSWPVVRIEVTDWERFDAELDEPNTPDLVGVAELAELCGVTRQRASVLARSGGFPEPLAELASGPVWDLRMVQRFVREWTRKPGRPAKSAKPSPVVANPAAVIVPAARASRHPTVEARPAVRRRTPQKETRMGLMLDILNDIRAEIAVDDDVLEEARNRRDLVAAAAMEIDGALRWFCSGSVAHGTVNAPVTDADAGIVLDRRTYPSLGPDGDGEGPEDIVKELGELVGPVVRESYPHATMQHSRRGLYVAFAAPLDGEQDPTVDLIVTLTRKGAAGLWIPDLDNNEWSASHPEKHTQLFTSGSKKQRALRARTARLAKAWNKQWAKDNRALSSFNIETLVWEYIDDDASVPLDEALAGWFAYAHDELKKGRTKDPAGVSEDIKLLLPKQTVLRRLASAADRLEQALDDETDEAKVKDLLAGAYPHYVEPPAQSKSAMAAALREGNQGVGASKTGLVIGGGAALKTTRSYGKDEQG